MTSQLQLHELAWEGVGGGWWVVGWGWGVGGVGVWGWGVGGSISNKSSSNKSFSVLSSYPYVSAALPPAVSWVRDIARSYILDA